MVCLAILLTGAAYSWAPDPTLVIPGIRVCLTLIFIFTVVFMRLITDPFIQYFTLQI